MLKKKGGIKKSEDSVAAFKRRRVEKRRGSTVARSNGPGGSPATSGGVLGSRAEDAESDSLLAKKAKRRKLDIRAAMQTTFVKASMDSSSAPDGMHSADSGRNNKTSDIFVGGLSEDTDESALSAAFGVFGDIIDVRLVIEKRIAFISYREKIECDAAIERMNARELGGTLLTVSHARDRGQHYSAQKPRESIGTSNATPTVTKNATQPPRTDASGRSAIVYDDF